MGLSVGTVQGIYASAIHKLQRRRGALAVLIAGVHAAQLLRASMPACGSVECDQSYLELHAERD
jgi:uncharacterized membrane protein YeaQ/YmgE (transglycosylase-associated protein family)